MHIGNERFIAPHMTDAVRMWAHVLAGLPIVVGVPLVYQYLVFGESALKDPAVVYSAFASFVGFILGLTVARKLNFYPGERRLENGIPAMVIMFLLTAAVMLMFRIDYSRLVIAYAAIAAIIFLAVVNYRWSNKNLSTYCVVPFGMVDRLSFLSSRAFKTMETASLPVDKSASLVADFSADLPPEWERMLARAALQGYPVYHYKQLMESLSGRVNIEHLSENIFGSLPPNRGYRSVRYALDFVAAGIGLIVASPIIFLAAIAIRLESSGPALYRQPRVGHRGQTFDVFKLRSMKYNGSAQSSHADIRNASVTQPNDQRITKVGRILRRYRLDELPQLANVLRGEMSLIGPRPEALALAEWYENELPFYTYRHIIKPGLTGWAQVNQGHVADIDAVHTKLQYDFYYIKYFSAWLDILIVMRTIKTIFSGFGAK